MRPPGAHIRRQALAECKVSPSVFNRTALGYFARCPVSADRRRLVARWLLDYGLTRNEVRALLGMDYTQVRRADEERKRVVLFSATNQRRAAS